MHQKRQATTTKLPIRRKGTKFVARSLSHIKNSVPLVVAVRDMLSLARNKKEVKKMIYKKKLKINGKPSKDYRESIKLFNILQSDKNYVLTLSKAHKFKFEEFKGTERLCKVLNKKMLKGKKIQLNFHDGSNILSSDNINVGDSVLLDFSGKIKSRLSFKEGKKSFIMSGKYAGLRGKIHSFSKSKTTIKLEDNNKLITIPSKQVIII